MNRFTESKERKMEVYVCEKQKRKWKLVEMGEAKKIELKGKE